MQRLDVGDVVSFRDEIGIVVEVSSQWASVWWTEGDGFGAQYTKESRNEPRGLTIIAKG